MFQYYQQLFVDILRKDFHSNITVTNFNLLNCVLCRVLHISLETVVMTPKSNEDRRQKMMALTSATKFSTRTMSKSYSTLLNVKSMY